MITVRCGHHVTKILQRINKNLVFVSYVMLLNCCVVLCVCVHIHVRTYVCECPLNLFNTTAGASDSEVSDAADKCETRVSTSPEPTSQVYTYIPIPIPRRT